MKLTILVEPLLSTFMLSLVYSLDTNLNFLPKFIPLLGFLSPYFKDMYYIPILIKIGLVVLEKMSVQTLDAQWTT